MRPNVASLCEERQGRPGVFGTEAAAAKDAAKKTSAKDKLKRRHLRESLAGLAANAKAKAKLASAVANAKTLRGAGLSVESFARTIATCSKAARARLVVQNIERSGVE